MTNTCPPHLLTQSTTHNKHAYKPYPSYITNQHFSQLERKKHPQNILRIFFSSDHFPIFTVLKTNETCSLEKTKIIKRDISSENIDTFKLLLENIKWDNVLPNNSPDKAYETFHFICSDLYNTAFAKRETEIQIKHLQSPWIITGLQKLSKRKQRLYEKFSKKRTTGNETIYKMYKNLLKKLRKNLKQVIISVN